MSGSLKPALAAWGYQPGDCFELAAIDPRGDGERPGDVVKVVSRRFTALGSAEAFVREHDGSRNLYLGANPLSEGFGSSGRALACEVTERRTFLLDVDPVGESVSGEALRAAASACLRFLGLDPAKIPMLDSGRGVQAWVPLGEEFRQSHKAAEADWIHRAVLGCQALIRCSAEFADFVAVDSTHDASRLMRLPGTTNLKTGRSGRWLNGPPGRGSAPDSVLTLGALEALNLPVPVTKKSYAVWSGDDTTEEEIARWVPEGSKAHKLWEQGESDSGGGARVADRSKRDAKFLLSLRESGCPAEVCCRLLGSLPGGKMRSENRGSDYFNSTLAWADSKVSGIFELRDLVDSSDPESLLLGSDPRYLNALACLDARAYARERKNLKAKGVSLGTLDKLVNDARRERRDRIREECGGGPSAALRDRVRFCHRGGVVDGWYIRPGDDWIACRNKGDVSDFVRGLGYEDPREAMASVTHCPLRLVNVPFAAEFPTPGEWNRHGARLSVEPARGEWGTWEAMLNHLGRGLDTAVQADPWCQEHGVTTGGQYLLFWAALLFQDPDCKLPYLFLFSEARGTGKSSLHESLSDCFADDLGVVDLRSVISEGFNEEAEGALLGTLEEYDLSVRGSAAYNKIKEVSLAPAFWCNPKFKKPFRAPNRIKMIHTANSRNYCPVMPDDDRIVVFEALPFEEAALGREHFRRRIAHERAAFLWHVTKEVVVPDFVGRYRLPAPTTSEKVLIQESNAPMLSEWLKTRPEWISWTLQSTLDHFLVDCYGRGSGRGWTLNTFRQALPDSEAKLRSFSDALRKSDLSEKELSSSEICAATNTQFSARQVGRMLNEVGRRSPKWVVGKRLLDGVTRYKFGQLKLSEPLMV